MNPLLVALDVATAEDAVRLAQATEPYVGGFKVGLRLLHGPGPATVAAIGRLGKPVFADAKLHDIPTQVEAAAFRLAELGARWITAHAGGGVDMLAAAVAGAAAGGGSSGILGVTVLTSLTDGDINRLAPGSSPGKLTARLARSVAEAGCEGAVAAVSELGVLAEVAPGILRVTPGIRPEGAAPVDQERVATPVEALRRGADYLVVGRPITEARDPAAAAAALAEEIGQLPDGAVQ